MKILTKSILQFSLVLLATTFFSCEDEQNVIGLNSTTKYGFIRVSLVGTRPDDEAFKVTDIYRFMPEEGPAFSSYFIDGNIYFNVQRMHGAVNSNHNDNYALLEFEANDEGFVFGQFQLQTSFVFGDHYALPFDENIIIPLEDVTSYSFNDETGKLRLNFSTVIPGENNSTGNELTVKIEASVTAFQGLNGPIGD